MKKWIPIVGLLLAAAACSKDDDRAALTQEPEARVIDHTNDLPTSKEFKKSESE